MTEAPAIVFDLDGTLVDSAPDLAAAMNHVLARHGRPAVALETVRQMIGQGVRALMAKGFAATGAPASETLLDRLSDEFIAYQLDHIADASRPFPGVEAALHFLAARGSRLGVLTNKPEVLSLKLLDALALERFFGAVTGGDTLAVRKPDAETFRETVRRLGGDPASAVMVGDSEIDVRTARNAGVPVIAVSFGYTATPVAAFGPDRLIDHFDALAASLDSLRAAGPCA